MSRYTDFTKRIYHRLPVLAVVMFPLALFAGPLFTGRALFWGLPALQFNPWRMAAMENILQGSLPFWNPWNGMGAPLLANYQLALFYPPSWLLYVFAGLGGTPALAWGHTLLVLLHLIWAGMGMTKLLASLGVGRLAQTVGGLAFCLSGYMTARNGVFPMVWAGAWLPWVILTARQTAISGKGFSRWSFVPGGLILSLAMLLLAGHAQLAWYTLILAATWVLFEGWSAGKFRGMLTAGLRFGLAGAAAMILASPQLVPTAELLSLSQRSSAVDYELGMQYSFWPWRLLAFFAPNFFGTPADGSYWGYASYWEDAAYIGLLPLLLSFSTLRALWKCSLWPDANNETTIHAPLSRLLWGVVFVSLILAMGKNTPIFPFFYRFIPTFDMFQAPSRYLILTDFSLAVLAGIGAAHWQKPAGAKLRWLKRGAVAAAAIALGSGAAVFTLREVEATFIGATALAGLGVLVAALLFLRMPPVSESIRYERWALLTALFIGIDLLIPAWGLRPTVGASFYADFTSNQTLRNDLGGKRVYLSQADEYVIKFWRFFRFNDYRPLEDWKHVRAALLPNLNILDGIATTGNFDPLVYSRYDRLMDYIEQLSDEERIPWLRMMGVGAVEEINVYDSGGVEFVPVEGGFRWYWTTCGQFVDGEEQSFAETVKLVETDAAVDERLPGVVLESEPKVQDCEAKSSAQIKLMKAKANRISFTVNAGSDGWLVLSDTWYPGWKVEVDGSDAEIIRANYLFRAAAVPEGQHVVVFTCSPDGFFALLAISLTGWIAVIFVTAYPSLRRRSSSNGHAPAA